MAYGIVHRFPGATKEQYEASIAAVHPNDGSLPEGQIFHAAGPSADGWTVVAIHDSQESWERFRDEKLSPALSAGIDRGFTTPPEEITFDVDKAEIQQGLQTLGLVHQARSAQITRNAAAL